MAVPADEPLETNAAGGAVAKRAPNTDSPQTGSLTNERDDA